MHCAMCSKKIGFAGGGWRLEGKEICIACHDQLAEEAKHDDRIKFVFGEGSWRYEDEERTEEERLGADSIPDNLGFNWASCAITPLWLFFHGRIGTGILLIFWGFISLILTAITAMSIGVGAVFLFQIIDLGIMLYFGFTGNEIAWKHKGYTSLEELKRRQRGWNIAGAIVFVLILLILIGSLSQLSATV